MIARLLLLIASLAFAWPANAAWHEAKTRHFIIYADDDPNELRAYATKLEQFDQAVRMARKMADPPLTDAGRLTIYAFKDIRAMHRVLNSGGRFYGIYVARASGAYAFVARNKPRGPGEVTSDNVFFHEYAHHLMLQGLSAYYPPWLVEGFAELLSTAVIDQGSVTFGSAADHRSAGVYAPDKYLTLSAMVGDSFRRLTSWQWELLYSRGWLLTHYLTFEPSRAGQLDRYVEGIRSGLSPADSAKAAFGDLLKLDRELDRYARRKTLTGTVYQIDPAKIGRIDIRPLSEAESAILPVRMQSDLGVTAATAGRVAGQARRIARRFPGDAIVQTSLAEAEFDADNFPAAIAAADRALAIDPSNVHALIYKGRALMRLAKANPSGADWNSIRSLFVRANQIDPENPEPLMLFYQTYKEQGAAPTPSAIKGILYALVLVPQDDELRLLAVRQLLMDSRIREAREAFAPLAFNPHDREFHDTAEEILAAIDSSDRAKALALIDSWEAKRERD